MKIDLNRFTPAQQRDYIEKMIAAGIVTITRCPDAAKQGDTCLRRKSGGGMLPGHLDPRTIGDTLEDVERAERERIAAPHNKRVASRKIKRAAA